MAASPSVRLPWVCANAGVPRPSKPVPKAALATVNPVFRKLRRLCLFCSDVLIVIIVESPCFVVVFIGKSFLVCVRNEFVCNFVFVNWVFSRLRVFYVLPSGSRLLIQRRRLSAAK